MSVMVKICGLSTPESLQAAVLGGAHMVGFVFYPRSPRYVDMAKAAALVERVPSGVDRVGLFVDADDEMIAAVLGRVRLDMLQLHGAETPERVVALRQRFHLPVIKAIKLAVTEDLDTVKSYENIADWLLFDAKVPTDQTDLLPGGNGVAFDWRLLAGRRFSRPWLLAGGINGENLARAVQSSGAVAVDVSSGVERAPGEKDPALIRAFLAAAAAL